MSSSADSAMAQSTPESVIPPPATKYNPENQTYVCLTHAPLNINATIDHVRSPKAGAIVLFVGAFCKTRINLGALIDPHL
jgi:hypothetical protein